MDLVALKVFIFYVLYCNINVQSKFLTRTKRSSKGDLILVHVLFRHGERTPVDNETYPTDPYQFENYLPLGKGQLTDKGKKGEYHLGQSLNVKYSDLIGQLYNPELLQAWTIDSIETKMSVELVLAGLVPPESVEMWNPTLYWQPIPYDYVAENDKVLDPIKCPNFPNLMEEYLNSETSRKFLKEHDLFLKIISNFTGSNIKTFLDLKRIADGLEGQQNFNFKLPEWAKKNLAAIKSILTQNLYKEITGTLPLKKLLSGYFLKKILADSTDKIEDKLKPPGRKLFLYSGLDINIGSLLTTLNFSAGVIGTPSYGSYVSFEIKKNGNESFIQLNYDNNESGDPRTLQIPGCNDKLCPLTEFQNYVEQFTTDQDLCQSPELNYYSNGATGLYVITMWNVIFILSMSYLLFI